MTVEKKPLRLGVTYGLCFIEQQTGKKTPMVCMNIEDVISNVEASEQDSDSVLCDFIFDFGAIGEVEDTTKIRSYQELTMSCPIMSVRSLKDIFSDDLKEVSNNG